MVQRIHQADRTAGVAVRLLGRWLRLALPGAMYGQEQALWIAVIALTVVIIMHGAGASTAHLAQHLWTALVALW